MTTDTTEAAGGPTPSRRSLIGWGGAGLALGAAAAGGAVAMARTGNDVDPAGAETGAAVAFHGVNQAGIATALQDPLPFAPLDAKTHDPAQVVQPLQDLTEAARRTTPRPAVG